VENGEFRLTWRRPFWDTWNINFFYFVDFSLHLLFSFFEGPRLYLGFEVIKCNYNGCYIVCRFPQSCVLEEGIA